MKLKWIALAALVLGLAPAMNAQFTQCPPTPKTDFDGYTFSGCVSLIIANADGTFTIKEDMSQPTNDVGHGEHDDALVGFQNNSGAPISAIRIAGCESSIDFTACFAFDGSGPVNNTVFCPQANPGPTGYEGPGVTFTNLDRTLQPCDTGTVNFSPPIAPGRSAYWFLERPMHGTVALPPPSSPTPTITNVFDQAAATSNLTAGMPIQVVGTGFGVNTGDSATVMIGTEAAPVLTFINSTNLIVQIPVDVPLGATNLTVTYKGQTSTAFKITIVAIAPEIEPFQSQNGSSFYDVNGNPITVAHPAIPNTQVYLLAIGLGTTNPPQVTNTSASAPAPTTQPVEVMVGNKMVQPIYAGLFVGGTPGFYQVSFIVPADAAMGNQQVTLSVAGHTSNAQTLVVAPPIPVIDAIVNGATFNPGAAAGNSFVSLFGLNFGTQDTKSNIFPATSFNGLSVLVNGTAVPLYFVVGSGGQINIVLPSELGASGNATVEVMTGEGTSAPFQLALGADSVGIFRIGDPSNAKRMNGAVLFSNTAWKVMPLSMAAALGLPSCASVTTASVCGKPAKVGDQIQIYLTGLGKATPNGDPNGKVLATGSLAPADGSVLYKTLETPVVKIGGVRATVEFSGIAPGNAGQYQINVAVPSGVKPGDDVTLEVTMQDGSTDTVTIAITG
jgi:uncharacterized protein (TIGR03437 family)